MAKQNLQEAGVNNVSIEIGDGVEGYCIAALTTQSLFSGSLPACRMHYGSFWIGGRMTIVVGQSPVMEAQLITCTAENTTMRSHYLRQSFLRLMGLTARIFSRSDEANSRP